MSKPLFKKQYGPVPSSARILEIGGRNMARIDGRAADQLRPVEIIPNINQFAEGSCLIRCGNTHVLCTASVEDRPPRRAAATAAPTFMVLSKGVE